MSEFSTHNPDRLEQRRLTLEAAMAEGGVLHNIASSVLAEQKTLSPDDVANILLPPRQPDEAYKARWELLEGSRDLIKQAAGANEVAVLQLAEQLDLRKHDSFPWEDVKRIDRDGAVWMVEGGANRTSVVRRELAFETMRLVHGREIELDAFDLWQFGSNRPITKEKNGNPNPEYKIAQEIAGDFLPKDDSLTEFELNLASAKQAGYVVTEMSDDRFPQHLNSLGIEKLVHLRKDNYPELSLVLPLQDQGGLQDGVGSVLRYLKELDLIREDDPELAPQPIVFTNGQYRAKGEFQVAQAARKTNIDTLAAIAIGDEPGFTINHNGKDITTAQRSPMVYINEAVVLHRISNK